MDKRTAKRKAHKIVSLLILQALGTAESWADSVEEQEAILAGLIEIADSHHRIGGGEEL